MYEESTAHRILETLLSDVIDGHNMKHAPSIYLSSWFWPLPMTKEQRKTLTLHLVILD